MLLVLKSGSTMSFTWVFGTNYYLQLCLSNPSEACLIVREANILKKDWEHTIIQTISHPSLAIVSATNGIASGWNSVWNEAFEHGVQGTKLIQTLFSALSRPVFGDRIHVYVLIAERIFWQSNHTHSILYHTIWQVLIYYKLDQEQEL